MHAQGIINGKYIELDQEIRLPKGSIVEVEIKPKALTLEEKRKLVDSLCGSWAEDESIKSIFEEIEAKRNMSKLREVNFL